MACPGPAMKLVGPLAACSPRLRLGFALEIERHCSADEILQGSSLGKCHLDDLLVRLSRADDAAVGPDGSPHPLPLFDDLRDCLVYDFTHFRERHPAPVPKVLDLLVD
jgi:hypothetical protein